ncbi:MAG: ABC transporter permease [Phycisphaeraceae bacterium]|nr:ABC transporter permease [Phycisphaeraceae bacterium]
MSTAPMSHEPLPLWAHLNPARMVRGLWSGRGLACEFARHEVEAEYKGQVLGVLWAVAHPLLLLAIYTFVFGVVFTARHEATGIGGSERDISRLALEIYVGILVFGVFREMVGRAPGAIVGRPQYVKKVVMPLEVFAVSSLLVALVNFALGMVVWLGAFMLLSPRHVPYWTIVELPLVLLPVCLLSLGLNWFLSALGVFLRDLRNVVELVVMMLFFMTPIFYRLEHVPDPYRSVMALSPMAQAVQGARAVLLDGTQPDWPWLGGTTAAAALVAVAGYAFFMKARRAFADVL